MITYLSFLPRAIKREGLPLYLIFYVTARCNQRCEHCFYWQRLNKKQKELSLREIEKISKSMGPLLWLSLTGGEPFLRPDLEKIAQTFIKNNQARHLSIPTNGSLTKRIVSSVKTMVSQNPKTTFSISLSCDGLEKRHDQIRGVKGSFKATLETAKELKKIKEKHKNLGLGMTMTLTKTNQDQFLKAYRFLRDKVGPDEIFINLVRGKPKNPETARVNLKIYEKAVKQKMEDIRKGKLAYYGFGLMSKVAAARDGVMHERIIKYKKGEEGYLPCLAGRLSAVISETGEVYPCELLSRSFGNLKDFGYDFKKLWESKKAEEIRRCILKNRCACTHECFLTINILFSPEIYPRLLTQLLWLYF